MLKAAEADPAMHAYIVVSLLTGARTEELRALAWSRLDLDGAPPTIALWRSVGAGGDIKTTKSRRTLELPRRCADALRVHRRAELERRLQMGVDGPTWTWSSPPAWGLRVMPRTSGERFGAYWLVPAWTQPSGHRGSCAIVSCH